MKKENIIEYEIKYRIVRSNRKTISFQFDDEAVVKAPFQVSDKEIAIFIDKNKSRIYKLIKRREEEQTLLSKLLPLTPDDIHELTDKALIYIPKRVDYFARLMGVSYGRITIRNQKSRWGSCSSKGNLNFNCLLMLTPPEVIDSVVVHELCHLKEMNHSKKFYNEVLKVYPEYKKWNNWLKKNGDVLIKRMIAGLDKS